uniref:Uncharacterized protein n=1 Tax=Arundo donax TaxID=35708 RepID=A0A0A9F4E9_ARUDO
MRMKTKSIFTVLEHSWERMILMRRCLLMTRVMRKVKWFSQKSAYLSKVMTVLQRLICQKKLMAIRARRKL